MGVPVVNDEGQGQLFGDTQLLFETFQLDLRRRVAVKKVKPDLPPGHDAPVFGQGLQLIVGFAVDGSGLVGMDSDSGI